MTLLIVGLLLFTAAHLYPAVLKESRDNLATSLGENAYRGVFSLVIVVSLVLIVIGWRSAPLHYVYAPPIGGGLVMALLMLAAFVLFVASQTPNNIRRYIRHPQMAAVILWSVLHLLANGETRSVLLFGSLGAWAIFEILLCNRRDGVWQKRDPAPLRWDAITVGIGAAAFVAIVLLHRTLFGIPAFVT